MSDSKGPEIAKGLAPAATATADMLLCVPSLSALLVVLLFIYRLYHAGLRCSAPEWYTCSLSLTHSYTEASSTRGRSSSVPACSGFR